LAADPAAMILAGGHSLLPALAIRGQRTGRLLDIGRIAALKTWSLDATGAVIGAGVTLSTLLRSGIARAYPALAEALRCVGNHVIRNRSTVGGCLGWSDPRGELPLILLAHDAVIRTSQREIAADAFITGPFANVLRPGEVIFDVRLPRPPALAFEEIIARNATGRAILSAACAVVGAQQVRITLGGLVDRPVRSDLLAYENESDFTALASTFVAAVLARFPVLPDANSLGYRQTVAPRLLRRCLLRALGT